MCEFFSCISDGNGKPYYFNWNQRQEIIKGGNPDYKNVESADSHSSIASFYRLKCDDVNKFEYNPLLGKFDVDQINTTDDKCLIEDWLRKVDFGTIVEPLVIKPIVHPFNDCKKRKATKKDIELLKQWASVYNSVYSSVYSSVYNSVRDSVSNSVYSSVYSSVYNSVRDSVSNSVWAYISSFVKADYKHDFTPCIKLWERGLVPSFDGTTWRLHSGRKAKIVWEGKINKSRR